MSSVSTWPADRLASHSARLDRDGCLLIRPLLAHCSNRSSPDTTRHRRILHLEFSGDDHLPDGFAWHDFVPGFPTTPHP